MTRQLLTFGRKQVRIQEAADLLQLQFVDHIIIGAPEKGRPSYFSFKENRLL